MAVRTNETPPAWLAGIVDEGLSREQKALPSYLFYDDTGSPLFEKITGLPEYYLTACETNILENKADEIVARVGDDVLLIEFGSGSSVKTRLIIEAILRRQPSLIYAPIDISAHFLERTAKKLQAAYPNLTVQPIAKDTTTRCWLFQRTTGRAFFLFLGSNIGNFEPEEAVQFLASLRAQIEPEDRLQMGLDLAKDPTIIEPAYNDSEGVTEAYNKNILARINRELGGSFDLDSFDAGSFREGREPYRDAPG